MNRFLRTAPARRLLAMFLGALAVLAAGTAIAVAATSGGPVASPKPLANAIHDALGGPRVQGLTARITFANHLIDTGSIQGSNPILSGSQGRLWLAPGRMRLELQSSGGGGDAQLVVDHGAFWVYDPTAKTVYRGSLAAWPGSPKRDAQPESIPSVATITAALKKLAGHLNLSGAVAGDTAGQPSYTVTASPRISGGLLGSVQLAWDAVHGVPLRFAVFAKGSTTPVIELAADSISYGPVPAADFAAAPPAGAKIVTVQTPRAQDGRAMHPEAVHADREPRPISGLQAVSAKLPFSLSAPATLAGRRRGSVRLLAMGGHRAALVLYGHDLDAVAVIESAAGPGVAAAGHQPGSDASTQGDRGAGVSLPTLSLRGGVTATELDTALGTVLHFQRAGVAYTVLGSVPRAVADAAARAL